MRKCLKTIKLTDLYRESLDTSSTLNMLKENNIEGELFKHKYTLPVRRGL